MLRLTPLRNPLVRTPSSPLQPEEISSRALQTFLDELVLAMEHYKGIGIAAPQVGKNIQAIVIAKEYMETPEHAVILNPRMVSHGTRTAMMEEGCLTVPGVYGPVARFIKLRVKGYDRNATLHDWKVKGMLARIFQHEIDHLHGVLFIDQASATRTIPKTPTNTTSSEHV